MKISIHIHVIKILMLRKFFKIYIYLGTSATGGYDCVMIPGAARGTMCESFTMAEVKNANRFCGNSGGLATKTKAMTDGTNSGTICSKPNKHWSYPFTTIFSKKIN